MLEQLLSFDDDIDLLQSPQESLHLPRTKSLKIRQINFDEDKFYIQNYFVLHWKRLEAQCGEISLH